MGANRALHSLHLLALASGDVVFSEQLFPGLFPFEAFTNRNSMANPFHVGRISVNMNDNLLDTYDMFASDLSRVIQQWRRRMANSVDATLLAKEDILHTLAETDRHPKRVISTILGLDDPEKAMRGFKTEDSPTPKANSEKPITGADSSSDSPRGSLGLFNGRLQHNLNELLHNTISSGYRSAFGPLAATLKVKRSIFGLDRTGLVDASDPECPGDSDVDAGDDGSDPFGDDNTNVSDHTPDLRDIIKSTSGTDSWNWPILEWKSSFVDSASSPSVQRTNQKSRRPNLDNQSVSPADQSMSPADQTTAPPDDTLRELNRNSQVGKTLRQIQDALNRSLPLGGLPAEVQLGDMNHQPQSDSSLGGDLSPADQTTPPPDDTLRELLKNSQVGKLLRQIQDALNRSLPLGGLPAEFQLGDMNYQPQSDSSLGGDLRDIPIWLTDGTWYFPSVLRPLPFPFGHDSGAADADNSALDAGNTMATTVSPCMGELKQTTKVSIDKFGHMTMQVVTPSPSPSTVDTEGNLGLDQAPGALALDKGPGALDKAADALDKAAEASAFRPARIPQTTPMKFAPPNFQKIDEMVDSLPFEGRYIADPEGQSVEISDEDSSMLKEQLKMQLRNRLWTEWVEDIVASADDGDSSVLE